MNSVSINKSLIIHFIL